VGLQFYACLQHGRGHIREIEKFIIRQPPKGEKDDYDSENSWISDGLPRGLGKAVDHWNAFTHTGCGSA